MIIEGGEYEQSSHVYFENLCLDDGQCYDLTIMDESGDGMSSGSIRLMYEGEIILMISGGDFDTEITESFCVCTEFNQFF